jgi:hypothetical protein
MVSDEEYSFEAELAEFKPGKDIIEKTLSYVREGVSCHLTLVTLEQTRFEIDWSI